MLSEKVGIEFDAKIRGYTPDILRTLDYSNTITNLQDKYLSFQSQDLIQNHPISLRRDSLLRVHMKGCAQACALRYCQAEKTSIQKPNSEIHPGRRSSSKNVDVEDPVAGLELTNHMRGHERRKSLSLVRDERCEWQGRERRHS